MKLIIEIAAPCVYTFIILETITLDKPSQLIYSSE